MFFVGTKAGMKTEICNKSHEKTKAYVAEFLFNV